MSLFLVSGCLNLFTGDVQEAEKAREAQEAERKAKNDAFDKAASEGRLEEFVKEGKGR